MTLEAARQAGFMTEADKAAEPVPRAFWDRAAPIEEQPPMERPSTTRPGQQRFNRIMDEIIKGADEMTRPSDGGPSGQERFNRLMDSLFGTGSPP